MHDHDHECNCKDHGHTNPLVPTMVKVVKITEETPDVKTFYVTTEDGIPFKVMPGQLAMVSQLPVGEGMFSVSWQGQNSPYPKLEFEPDCYINQH
jgi:hypothetical protein